MAKETKTTIEESADGREVHIHIHIHHENVAQPLVVGPPMPLPYVSPCVQPWPWYGPITVTTTGTNANSVVWKKEYEARGL